MNIGDIVYIYLFDLEKSILHMNKLRDDRFGRIVSITTRNVIGETQKQDLIYTVKASNKIMEYEASNINYSIINLPDLLDLIENVDLSTEKRDKFFKQIQQIVKQL